MFDLSDPKTNALGYLFQEWEECACRSILAVGGSGDEQAVTKALASLKVGRL